MRKKTLWTGIALVLALLPLLSGCGPTPIPEVIEKEVEVTKAGMGTLVCCNQPMQIKEEDESK